MTALLYSAIFGGYDTVKPVAGQTVEHDQVMVYDGNLGGEVTTGWTDWYDGFAVDADSLPRLAARWPKCIPPMWDHFTHSIWIDGSITITSPTFVADMLALVPDDGPDFALFVHPDRSTLVEELEAIRGMGKYEGVDHDAMVYELCAAARHWPGIHGPPLYACGVLVRRHTPRMADLGRRWWEETLAWSTPTAVPLDQLSLPPLLTALDIVPAVIPGNIWTGGDGGWFTVAEHPVDR